MEKHAEFSPSRLSRVIKCPGSHEAIKALPSSRFTGPSEYALQGTKLHSYTHDYYQRGNQVLNDLTKDEQNLVLECVEYLEILIKSIAHTNYATSSEQQVSLMSWGLPEIWGTSDRFVVDHLRRHADIIDWKFGSGEIVYAEENAQLMAYAAGAIKHPSLVQTITLHIFQPAVDHVSTWDLTISDLYEWVHGTLAIALSKSQEFEPEVTPGVEQCRWCEAKNDCIPRMSFVQAQASELFKVKTQLAQGIPSDEIYELIKKAPLVEDAIKSLKLFVKAEIELGRGEEFPEFKLVSGQSNRKWKDEKQATQWLIENTTIEDIFKSTLLSPSQIEKEARTLKKNETFKTLYEKPPGKTTLVFQSDPRSAIPSTSSAIDVFSDI